MQEQVKKTFDDGVWGIWEQWRYHGIFVVALSIQNLYIEKIMVVGLILSCFLACENYVSLSNELQF